MALRMIPQKQGIIFKSRQSPAVKIVLLTTKKHNFRIKSSRSRRGDERRRSVASALALL